MKKILYKVVIVALCAFITSCSSDEQPDDTTAETGKLSLKFDNSYNNNDLILDTQTITTAHNEKLKVNVVRYIVSNIVLTKEDGTTFTYPKAKSYFIADENDAATGYQFDIPIFLRVITPKLSLESVLTRNNGSLAQQGREIFLPRHRLRICFGAGRQVINISLLRELLPLQRSLNLHPL